ncbi:MULTISPECIES: pyruvate carboxylase [unclassified Granulicatella]|uniref:pyruvate carboxylase n=1 Tax=unclassified Granulicatella TaxID=2630493 RepID=UPI001073732E|nr:pyruvate carboxylase [Granulicatella sp. WM01]MBF0780066.1 pyruvate carboxylase [Granulicatella sp. 19428wC4_WM01]TFU95864.1 pyruvate carboxylase [Granulicatella sp. WM01]
MQKILVANRGEIAIRIFRAANELNIKTVAIYAKEDEQSVHRFKADEAYLVGEGKRPIEAYLDIEHIIAIAKDTHVDAIHPGYGFLSENREFAKRCQEEGFIFIGPSVEHLDILGDKVKAKDAALKAGLQSIPGTNGPVKSIEDIYTFAKTYGYPIMIKAALGGGGRGMRIVRQETEVEENYLRASSEAKSAFGSAEVYVEKYIENPKHIEVQVLGDKFGQAVHLFERDCSVQRRHQKVVEVAPCVSMSENIREKICHAAKDFLQSIGYQNAGTVEFLWVGGDEFYFIEVNPRIQVEHTITELITGFDIVQAQILIAQGKSVFESLNIATQDDIRLTGAAIQCRITTEDPENQFIPDTGKINTYRSPGGYGIRLDAGNGFQGSIVTPYFDSMLVKCCTYGRTFQDAVLKMKRALIEFRIRGVKTNIAFMQNVISHDEFSSGHAKTTFIDTTPELFVFSKQRNRGNKMLAYISDVSINGFAGIPRHEKGVYHKAVLPKNLDERSNTISLKHLLDEKGAHAVANWVTAQKEVLITDTTFRDAHQSLLATRVRSRDLTQIASIYDQYLPELFSIEAWGGATFDTAYRFLLESPWDRLSDIRKQMPNTLLQMLIRGANAVGYQNYPDNVIEEFIALSAKAGIDIFRIFDSLNWLPQMEKSIQAVRDNGKIAEVAMCYTGDVLNTKSTKYNLDYYVNFAKEIEQSGAHILAIKDMAGLLKPQAAYQLISRLKDTVSIPIHLHTHDTSGNGIYTYAAATKAGVDIVDVAMGAFSGATSQPSMSTLLYGLDSSERMPSLSLHNIEKINHYWNGVRRFYDVFETKGQQGSQTSVYQHEMPGGQFTNLQQQAKAMGIKDEEWEDVEKMYAEVNQLFGDIVKVTPSSKVVGDMALFMLKNKLTSENIFELGKTIDFPESVRAFFKGDLGQPVGGFPKALQQLILKQEKPFTCRPGLLAKPISLEQKAQELEQILGEKPSEHDVISYVLYPKVFLDYQERVSIYGDLSPIDTPTFFHGMRAGEEISVEIEKGKTLSIRLIQIGEPDSDGNRIMYFNFNGQSREITVKDSSVNQSVSVRKKAEPTNRYHVGATMPGTIVKLLVKKGDVVKKGDPLLVTESMKMETTIQAQLDGTIDQVYVHEADLVDSRDLLLELK